MSAETATPPAGGSLSTTRIAAAFSNGGTVVGLIVLIAVFSILKPETFPTWDNVLTILTQASLLGIVAGGLTVCLILGEFDLSIGFVVTLGGTVAAVLLGDGSSVPIAVIAGVAAGAVVGLANGIVIAYGRVNAFIVTLGSGSIIAGLVLLLTGGKAQLIDSPDFLSIGQDKILGIPQPVWFSFAVLLLLWLFINKTEVGRRIDAVGGNAEASRLSGIRVPQVRVVGFIASGLAAALAGVLLSSQLGSSSQGLGDPYLLQAFTACFLGAVTLRESEFHILGTAIGVLIMAVTFNGLAQLGVEAYWTNIAQGGILIVAVLISSLSGRIRLRPRRA